MDGLKKLAVAVIVLVACVTAGMVYVIRSERALSKTKQENTQLKVELREHKAIEEALYEENCKLAKRQQLYKEQAEKSKKELAEIKKVEIYKNSVLDDRVKKFIEDLCYVCECD